jgi:rubrerythrin
MANVEKKIGTKNVTYNVTSVLYHALQGAETYMKYLEDAQQFGDQETIKFFQQAVDQQTEIAEQAKRVLHKLLMEEEQVEPVRER